jgi:heme-degrading monooxygenase HmoA
MRRSLPFLFVLALTLSSTTATPQAPSRMSPTTPHVIARMWHGRVPEAKKDEYRQYLIESGIRKLEAIPHNLGADVLERTANGVTEFTVISYWPSLDDIRAYAGPDIEKTHNLPRDHEFLIEMEPNVRHFEVVLSDRH